MGDYVVMFFKAIKMLIYFHSVKEKMCWNVYLQYILFIWGNSENHTDYITA